MPVAIPSLQGYVLTTPAVAVNVAAVQGYALTVPIATTDFTKLFPAAFLAAINKQFKRSFTAALLTFGSSTTLNTDQVYNTSITATAKYGSGFSGTKTLRYTRFPLSQAFAGKTVVALPTMQSTIVASLPALNTQYGLNLQSSDIVDGAVDGSAKTVTLTVKEGSGFFVPGTQFTVGMP